MSRKTVRGTSPDSDKIIAIFEKIKDSDKTRIFYGDRDTNFIISKLKFDEFRKRPRTSNYIIIKFDKQQYKTLREQYEATYKEAVYLKELTTGKINLFRTGSTGRTALQLFYDLCPQEDDPDSIDDKETEYLRLATSGALIWGIKYKGKGYKYDVVSHYPSIMLSRTLKIPYGKPEYHKLTQNEFNEMKFYRYGIYHVKVIDPNYKVFRENGNDWYTHTDLNHALRTLKYKLELVDDGEINALIYPKLKSIRSVFKPFIDYLFQFKKDGVKEVKKYINALWGALSQKNILDCPANQIYSDKMIFSMRPSGNGINDVSKHTATVYKQNQYYELGWARISHFILASGRAKISKVIYDNLDTCIRCHTDGIICTKLITNVILGDNIGDLKFEESGQCEIIDSCTYTFNNVRHGRKEIDPEEGCMFI